MGKRHPEEATMFDDDFEDIAEFRRQSIRGEHHKHESPLTSWERLAQGKTVGGRVPILFTTGLEQTRSQVFDIIQVIGADADEQQLSVTLSPPQVAVLDAANIPANFVNVTGTQDNVGLLNNWNPGAAAPVFPGLATPFKFTESRAIIEWGAGGVQDRVEADICNGLCLNLCASFVRVRAVIGPQLNAGIDGNTAVYIVSAHIGPSRPKDSNAQRTVWCGSIGPASEGPGNAGAFPIPRFAKSVSLVAGQNGAAPDLLTGTLRFWQRADAIAASGNVGNFLFTGNADQRVNVPNGAYYFSIINGMANPALFAAVFDLAV